VVTGVRARARTVVVAVVVLGLGGFACLLLLALDRARAEARRTMCVHNLKMIGMSLHMYQKDNDGVFPTTFAALYPEYTSDDMDHISEVFVCPEFRKKYEKEHGEPYTLSGPEEIEERSSYVLIPGRHVTDDKDTVLVYERGDNHGGKGHSLLYVDGRGGWDPPSN